MGGNKARGCTGRLILSQGIDRGRCCSTRYSSQPVRSSGPTDLMLLFDKRRPDLIPHFLVPFRLRASSPSAL